MKHLPARLALLGVFLALIATPGLAQSCPDSDADGVDDCVDNCPSVHNPYQSDGDGDDVGDLCDNCWFDYNPDQTNIDADEEGDRCDWSDGMIYIFRLYKDWVDWQQELDYGGGWNFYEGDLAVLRATGEYTQEPGSNPLASRVCGIPEYETYVRDLTLLEPGEVVFHLVTGLDPVDGHEGTLGPDSEGTIRPLTHPCP